MTDADQPTDASQRPTVPARPDPNIMSPTAVDISTFQAWQKAKPYRGQACSVSYSPPGQSMQVVSGKYFEEIISRKGEVVGFEVLLPKHGRVESFLFEFIDKATV
ncbi:hypothetical protein JW899_02200 [Candidatus Uhrbacteria bacterium]|nr:hypothetical protein [Candidatus Uhrbacteria bacterium]